MEKKILEGQRKSPTKNVKFIKDLQDGNISKIKKSTVFPDSWNDSKIMDNIENVGESPAISVRQRDGATWHRQAPNQSQDFRIMQTNY